ncbi:hypothetical protein [Geobacillus sp. FSL W8-1251]|uniref:hypothetical protein n=1 Tax=Geobacillus sp. FSL W8-1251 TaxID=2954650 RepID=UPI0030F5952C
MAEISKFFNSAPGDPRAYQASDFADYFGSVLSTGLLHTDNIPALEVKCDGNDLRTYVTPGKAIMQGYLYENTSNLYLEHALPEATYDRIDRIVLRLDKRNQSRFIRAFVKQGTPSENPVPPELQRDDFIYELSLAQIRVRANTSTLNPADLIDERLDENLCGLVHSLISIPTSQFQAEWDAFMASVQDEGFTPRTEFDAHLADYVKHPGYGVATGSANAYEVTLNPAPTAYVEGMAIAVKINMDNTGASTINVNGLGAKAIKKPNGNDVSAGNLKAGSIYTLRYNGTNFILQGEGGSGNAQPSDVLSGKTFTNDSGEQTGTMPNIGAITITPTTIDQTIPAGYHNGSGIVKGDPDLIPANIKQGVDIFGVVGTLVEGKRWASGTFTTSEKTYTVSGLAFKPSIVLVYVNSINTARWMISLIQRVTPSYAVYPSGSGKIVSNIAINQLDWTYKPSTIYGLSDSSQNKINNDGFTVNLLIYSNGWTLYDYAWIAIE